MALIIKSGQQQKPKYKNADSFQSGILQKPLSGKDDVLQCACAVCVLRNWKHYSKLDGQATDFLFQILLEF